MLREIFWKFSEISGNIGYSLETIIYSFTFEIALPCIIKQDRWRKLVYSYRDVHN